MSPTLLLKVRPFPALLPSIKRIFRSETRFYSSNLNVNSIVYESYGLPAEVVQLKTSTLSPVLEDHSVLLRMLAAPINPADINQLEGVYALLPPLPAVGGNEGVAQVLDLGNKVSTLKKGDWVIPSQAGWGTWRTHAVANENDLSKIPNDIPIGDAATISVNPCTALRMLEDFVNLEKGDYVIQNGATSAVGRAVIQIAAAKQINTINIIRSRSDIESNENTKQKLKNMGATYVFTEEEARNEDMKIFLKQLGKNKPKLGLNCVGGQSSTSLMRCLQNQGVLVTYGGMSKKPVMVSTAHLIFKDLNIRGFWMTRWIQENSKTERENMLADLGDMIKKKQLATSCQYWDYKNYKNAVNASLQGGSLKKQVMVFDDSFINKLI